MRVRSTAATISMKQLLNHMKMPLILFTMSMFVFVQILLVASNLSSSEQENITKLRGDPVLHNQNTEHRGSGHISHHSHSPVIKDRPAYIPFNSSGCRKKVCISCRFHDQPKSKSSSGLHQKGNATCLEWLCQSSIWR
jgi:hypothetical protein